MNNKQTFFKNLSEAEKTLQYTLLLPAPKSSKPNIEEIIDTALLQTYKNCHLNLTQKLGYDFFGRFKSEKSIGGLFQSAMGYSCDNISDIYRNDFFGSSILSQCVMAAYDTVVQLLTSGQYITPYAMNKIKASGFNQCLEKDLLTIPFYFKKQKENSSALSSSEASGLNSKLQNRISILKNNGFNTTGLMNEDRHINFNMATILYKIATLTSPDFKHFLSLYKYKGDTASLSTDTLKSHEIIKDFCDGINYNSIYQQKSGQLSNGLQADLLYYYYKIEKIFNVNLAACAMQFIDRLKEKGLYPDGKNDMENLSLISKFPNVFSRNFYLQYALDSIHDSSDIYNNCFSKLSQPSNAIRYVESHPYDIYKWNITFKQFCNLFTKLLIPADEWYFLSALFKIAGLEKSTFDLESVVFLHSLLKKYISRNAAKIIYPAKDLLETTIFPVDDLWDVKDYIKNPSVSPAPLLHYFKNEYLIEEMPIPYFNKETILQRTKADITYQTIIHTYIQSVITDVLPD